jgi:hypothetical protein
MRVLVTLN